MPVAVPFYDAPTSTLGARYNPRSLGRVRAVRGLFDASCGCRPWWYLLLAAGAGAAAGALLKPKKRTPRRKG